MAEFERSHEALVEQYNTLIRLCSRMLAAEARTLNDLDHLLAEKKVLPLLHSLLRNRVFTGLGVLVFIASVALS